MRCFECTAGELMGLAEENTDYCPGLLDVHYEEVNLTVRDLCGAVVMAKVSHNEIQPSEVIVKLPVAQAS